MSETISYKTENLDNTNGVFIKAILNNQIIASLLAEIENDYLLLHSINVNRNHRRKGIASKMIAILRGNYPKTKIKGTLLPQDNLSTEQLSYFYKSNDIPNDGKYRGKIGN